MDRFNFRFVKYFLSVVILLLFMLLSAYFFNLSSLWGLMIKIWNRPVLVFLIMLFYFLSFCLKAWAWKLYLNNKPRFKSCLLGILYSLLINHISPIKAGDFVRAGLLSARDDDISIENALHSVVILRSLDIMSLFLFSMIGLVILHINISIPFWLLFAGLIGGGVLLLLLKRKFSAFYKRQLEQLKSALLGINGLYIVLLTLISWVIEAAVLFGTVLAVNQELSIVAAVWVNSLTIAGQIFQITPGGIANYETIMTFALGTIGFSLKDGYAIAIMTHGIKFLFSYLAGAYAIFSFPVPLDRIRAWIKHKGVMRT